MKCYSCGREASTKHYIGHYIYIIVHNNICPKCAKLPFKPKMSDEYYKENYK